jgi:cytochrome o ubiquinol oxidase subunit II
MRFTVEAVPIETFAQWVDAVRSDGPVLDTQTYAELVKPSSAVTPFTYRAVAPDLFKVILNAGMRPPGDPSSLTSPMPQRVEK